MEYDSSNARREMKKDAMSQEERDASNAKRRDARKKKKKIQGIPNLNSTALIIDREEIQGVCRVTSETEVQEIVTHYHSVEVERPLPTIAKNLLFKNVGRKSVRARTEKSVSELKKIIASSLGK